MLEAEHYYIEKAQAGDHTAFQKLYEHYVPKIYRFVYLKVSSKSEAEDLTHEVFLNVWQNLGRYTHQGFPFSSWVYQIARNEVIDFYRTKKKTVPLEDIDENFLKTGEHLQHELHQSLNLEKVRGLIPLLHTDQQDVLIMRFVEDLSHKEIAQTLNKSEGAVRLIQHRALNNLKKLIQKQYGSLI